MYRRAGSGRADSQPETALMLTAYLPVAANRVQGCDPGCYKSQNRLKLAALNRYNPLQLRMVTNFMNRNRKANIVIPVHDNVDRALRQLKKKIEREGVSRDMKRSVYFEPASQKKRKRLIRAVKQNLLRMATQGLIDISKHTLPS